MKLYLYLYLFLYLYLYLYLSLPPGEYERGAGRTAAEAGLFPGKSCRFRRFTGGPEKGCIGPPPCLRHRMKNTVQNGKFSVELG